METIGLGRTGLTVNRFGFGGIPIPDLIRETLGWLDARC